MIPMRDHLTLNCHLLDRAGGWPTEDYSDAEHPWIEYVDDWTLQRQRTQEESFPEEVELAFERPTRDRGPVLMSGTLRNSQTLNMVYCNSNQPKTYRRFSVFIIIV